jgi:hypothetical protein
MVEVMSTNDPSAYLSNVRTFVLSNLYRYSRSYDRIANSARHCKPLRRFTRRLQIAASLAAVPALSNRYPCKSREATRSDHVGLSYITQPDAWPNAEVGTNTDKGIAGGQRVSCGATCSVAGAGHVDSATWIERVTLWKLGLCGWPCRRTVEESAMKERNHARTRP